jgi:hypothetical protein
MEKVDPISSLAPVHPICVIDSELHGAQLSAPA